MTYKRRNPNTGEIEIITEGIIKKISNNTLKTRNKLQRPYKKLDVEITYPNGMKKIVNSMLFESLQKKLPNYFNIDSTITLAFFTEGNHKDYNEIIQPRNTKNFIKLPESIKSNVLWVDDFFRTNNLSFLPGGYCIIIEYSNGSILGYDKIKFKEPYIHTIIENHFSEKNINLTELGNEEQKEIIKIYISNIYFKEISNENDYDDSDYELIWSKDNSEFLPWE